MIRDDVMSLGEVIARLQEIAATNSPHIPTDIQEIRVGEGREQTRAVHLKTQLELEGD